MLSKLKQALHRTASLFIRTRGATLHDIEELLLAADVGVKYATLILKKIEHVHGDATDVLKQELVRLLTVPAPRIETTHPLVMMVSGVNGSGKTTTIAKLAHLYKKKGSVICACADTYRDAANEQLGIWAERAGVEIVASQKGQDAGAVVYDTMARAQVQSVHTVIIDTAGRLHTRGDLMNELKKIRRVITKFKAGGPDLNILTVDAQLGQNSIQQARIFAQEIGINSLILTKCDGTAKGGAIIPICNELKLPVLYLGIGEGIEDLIEFNPQEFVEALFTTT